MAVVRYKCDVCKRELEVPENKRGLDFVDRCIITEGCRGSLYKLERKQDFLRGEFPAKVPGLRDYTPRRVLYNHTQAIAATEWFIEHNLGVAPSVQVLIEMSTTINEEQELVPCVLRNNTENFDEVETTDFTINIISPNELTIIFPNPQSGIAQLIARSSAPITTEEAEEAATPTFQLTTSTIVSIATLNSTIPSGSSIDLSLVYTPPGSSSSITQSYTVPTTIAAASPWNDFPSILIQGRQYKVRSFDAFISEMGDGTIPNGSSFYFSQIDTGSGDRAILSREVIVLLALSPYDDVDKVKDQLIDASRVTAINAELSFFYQDRELFAFTPIITSTFPPIREV